MTETLMESEYLQPYYARFHALYGGENPVGHRRSNVVFMAWISAKWRKFYAQHPEMPRGMQRTRDAFLVWLNAEES